jgi:hypothetical protein
METRKLAPGLGRFARRAGGSVRSLRPGPAIVLALAVILGGFGVADAATGGAFLLGRANHESSTASLVTSHGIPLSLSAPKGKAPLAVNRSTEVKHLNAEYVGGLSASVLKPSGGDDYAAPDSAVSLPALAEVGVANTGPLPAGTYYVTATADINLATGDPFGGCIVTLNNDVNNYLQAGDESGGPRITVAETLAVAVPAKGSLQEYCGISGSAGGSTVNDAGLTAIKILSSSGTAPAK